MLSILIPTYCYNPQPLVDELNRQASVLDIEYEILVLDDASPSPVSVTGCTLIRLDQNRGRSYGRNLLASRAKHPYLLFLDSDSYPADSNFLKRYMDNVRPGIVLSGGRIYHPQPGSLLTLYGTKERNPKGMQGSDEARFTFLSPNFLIDAEIFNTVRFDETLTLYGHEDTIFGIQLTRHSIPYYRFDNPVYHEHIEPNDIYLRKVEQSLRTLLTLLPIYPELRSLPIVRLSHYIPRLPVCHLRKTIINRPSLPLLQLYKLLYLKNLVL